MDTLFIVFRKKPLLILHTYHHLVTGIYGWSTMLYPTPLGLWMATNNLYSFNHVWLLCCKLL